MHTPSVQVACFATLPGVLGQWAEAAGTDVHAQVCVPSIHRYLVDSHPPRPDCRGACPNCSQEVYWVYVPSVLGSAGFVFASYVYVVEVMRDHSILRTDPNPYPNP